MIILFSFLLFPLIYTYLIYPSIVSLLFYIKNKKRDENDIAIELPIISVIMPVHNEEKVIETKILSLLNVNYPPQKIFFFIGSDHSTDLSDSIISKYADHKKLRFYPYSVRIGKSGMINKLFQEVKKVNPIHEDHIIIFTDANVIPDKNCFLELAKSLAKENIGLADSRMIAVSSSDPGISEAEKSYINFEVELKHKEGKLWGYLMGPFGGCYAIKSHLFIEIPETYCVDDFFISTNVLLHNYKAVSSREALCYEKVSKDLKEEFNRKKRISSGNFQNLNHFKTLWLPPQEGLLSFVFVSHKLLRWLGPFFLFLAIGLAFWMWPVWMIAISLIVLSENIFSKIKFHIPIIRKVHYFLAMNVAVLLGFILYLKGTEYNVWEPPKRI